MIDTDPEKRKIFLQNLKQMAAAAASLQEIAYKLDFKNGDEFEKFLEKDKEARNIWKQARTDCWIKSRAAIVIAAQAGQAKAIEVLDRLLQEEQPNSFVPENLTATQLAKLVGKTYQTIWDWTRKNGLPREKNKKYNLLKFFTWYGKYKFGSGKKKGTVEKSEDELRGLKAEELRLELDEKRGNLLDRKEVLSGIVVRHQKQIQHYDRLPELATNVEKKSYEQIVIELEKFFEKLISEQREDFIELKLPAQAKNLFLRLLKMLGGKA